MDNNQVLAELLGWDQLTDAEGDPYWRDPERSYPHDMPEYDTDHNAMLDVWEVIQERGLWKDFLATWYFKKRHVVEYEFLIKDDDLYRFLNDQPGQVEAAIKVLQEDSK